MSEQQLPRQAVPALTQAGGIAPGLHHIHPAYVVLNAVQWIAGLFIVVVATVLPQLAEFTSTIEGQFGSNASLLIGGIGIFILLLAVVGVVSFISYKRFLWEITESEIHIYSGIIFKKQVHIPFQRVQSIDFNAGLLERVLGIVRLTIETAGGATNKGVRIPALKLNQAEALRSEVFARKRVAPAVTQIPPTQILGGPTDGFRPPETSQVNQVREIEDSLASARGILAENYYEEAPVEYEYGLTLKEVLLSAISNDQHLVAVFVVIGFLSQLPQLLGMFIGSEFESYEWFYEFLAGQALPFIITICVIGVVLVLLISVASSAINFGGFKARRRGGRIEVERGLLQRQYRGVAISRVQTVEVKQGFLRRIVGYAEINLLTVDSVSESQGNNQARPSVGLLVHPFVRFSKVDTLLAGLLPEFSHRPKNEQLRPLPGKALRRAIIRGTLWPYLILAAALIVADQLTVLIGLADIGDWRIGIWTFYAALVLIAAINSVLWYRHAGYAYNQATLAIRQGGYGMKTSYIPRNKIQFATTHENPIQRFAHLATISARTAAGVGGTTIGLRDLDSEAAADYLDWARPVHRRD